jgi:hypothetical protein
MSNQIKEEMIKKLMNVFGIFFNGFAKNIILIAIY